MNPGTKLDEENPCPHRHLPLSPWGLSGIEHEELLHFSVGHMWENSALMVGKEVSKGHLCFTILDRAVPVELSEDLRNSFLVFATFVYWVTKRHLLDASL